ncbi:MAG: hypothetical protein HOP33_10610 [Verrucomicrobia bacterium]|nr:hypothetical protein [Verrucomicrobiota bacterium]
MNGTNAPSGNTASTPPGLAEGPMFAPIFAGIVCWAAISIGFFGLKMLMHERPEFVGPPMRATQVELVQESPQVVVRKINDDISVIKPAQPESSDVSFDMDGRRDYRGLRTTLDMSGEFRAKYVLTNAFEEPVFALFKCPHPRAQTNESQSLLAGDLKLQSSIPGAQENTKDAWFWSGTIEPHTAATVEISYHVASLKGVAYHISDADGNQIKQLRVAIRRKDIPAMRFESGDGTKITGDETVTWERRNFLAPDFFSGSIYESRNLFTSLSHVLEIGPVISLLFLLTVSAIILTRQSLTVVQMLTIAASYALYFPLILYLSSRFQFAWALIIAFVVPGALLVNYSRWLVGGKLGLIGAPILLALYQVFPTLAAFAGWNRGMLLLCLGIVTLAVLINLQNQSLRRRTAGAAAMLLWLTIPTNTTAADVQLILPAELTRLAEAKRETTNSLVAFDPVQYQVRHEAGHLRVEATVPFQVLRVGETTVPVFSVPVHLQESNFDPADADLARLVAGTNHLALYVQRAGSGKLRLSYLVPVVNRDGKKRAQIPLVPGPSGNVQLESPRDDIEVLTGNLWAKNTGDKTNVHDIGVAGLELLIIEWRDEGDGAGLVTTRQIEASKEFYGIGLTRAQHLTVVNSDGSCTHFSEFEMPAIQNEEFRMKLPEKARLISVSVNGNEIRSPVVEAQLCRVRLPQREGQQTSHRLSFRVAYPAMRLGFVGTADLALPEVFQTTGILEWVVALPNGFDAQVISSGLERQKTSPDLGRFGDYGRILQSHAHTSLAKDLAPPGAVGLSLKYRQKVAGFFDARAE